MNNKQPWKQISRKTVFDTPFLKVYQDKVGLPNGKFITDYTLVEKPSVVVIVAINLDNQVLLLNEFKYAAGRFLWGLPAGHIKINENSVAGAKRELGEETGIIASNYLDKGVVNEYPTKDLHTVHVVVATGLQTSAVQKREDTETLDKLRFFSKSELHSVSRSSPAECTRLRLNRTRLIDELGSRRLSSMRPVTVAG